MAAPAVGRGSRAQACDAACAIVRPEDAALATTMGLMIHGSIGLWSLIDRIAASHGQRGEHRPVLSACKLQVTFSYAKTLLSYAGTPDERIASSKQAPTCSFVGLTGLAHHSDLTPSSYIHNQSSTIPALCYLDGGSVLLTATVCVTISS